MSLIISGDILGVKGYEDEIFYVKDFKVVGYTIPENFYKSNKEEDFVKLDSVRQTLANQALESYIIKIGTKNEFPSGMIVSNEIMAKIDLSKEKIVKEIIKPLVKKPVKKTSKYKPKMFVKKDIKEDKKKEDPVKNKWIND